MLKTQTGDAERWRSIAPSDYFLIHCKTTAYFQIAYLVKVINCIEPNQWHPFILHITWNTFFIYYICTYFTWNHFFTNLRRKMHFQEFQVQVGKLRHFFYDVLVNNAKLIQKPVFLRFVIPFSIPPILYISGWHSEQVDFFLVGCSMIWIYVR